MALPISNTRSAEMERVSISSSVPTAGPDDRHVLLGRQRLHLREHRIARRKEIQDVTIELGSDERSHGGIL